MSAIVKCKHCEPNIDSFQILKSYLPEEYEYMVCSFTCSGSDFKTRLRTSGKRQDYAQKWLEDFQMYSKCTMRVERTYPHSGTKNVFKIDLRCQHNTRPRSEKVREKESCKNTDCPAKMGITIKRVVTERKSRSKDPHLPDYPTVISMDFRHNHAILAPEILKHRSVLPEVKEKILNLFKLGHNPSTALDMHKYDLQLEHGENYGKVAQDRALLPDPQFCYRLYYKIVRKQSTSMNGDLCIEANNSSTPEPVPEKKFLTSNLDAPANSSIEDCSPDDSTVDGSSKKAKKKRKLESTVVDKKEMASQLEDVLCKFCESGGFAGMQLIDDNTVMALCTPLMHRVHTLVRQSGELVFVDSYGDLDEPNSCRVLMFVTYSGAGPIPLGCLVTTAATPTCIKAALDLWKQILPDGCFNNRSEGPQIFLTNDNDAERQSLKASFPQSHLLICISHILQASWNFLWDRKNGIKKDHRSLLFAKIKMLLFSQTVDELEMNYAYTMQDSLVKIYSIFVDHFNHIYNHRHDWALVYRRHLLPRGHDITIFWEVAMILLKDPILSRTRTYNQLQIIDFLSRLDTYYELRLIDMANGRYENVKLSRFLFIDMPREAYTITQKSESEYEVHNDTKDTTYHVDITLGMCECRTGKSGAPCKHQLLVFRNFTVPSYDCIQVNSTEEKKFLIQLATGQEVENGPIVEITNHVPPPPPVLSETCTSESLMHDLGPCSDGDFFLGDGGPCDSLGQHSVISHNSVLSQHTPALTQHASALNQHTSALSQHTSTLSQHTSTLSEHTSTLSQHTATLSPHTSTLSQHTSALSQHTSTMSQHSATLNQHNSALNAQGSALNQHTPVLSQQHNAPLSQHSATLNQHQPTLGQHTQVLGHHTPVLNQHTNAVLNHHTPTHLTQHVPTLNQSAPSLNQQPSPLNQQPPLNQQLQTLNPMPPSLTQAPPPPPMPQQAPPTTVPQHIPPQPPPPPQVPPAQPSVANQPPPQLQTAHELIDQACKKLKDRTSRLPHAFIPALDTFLKNFDKLSSESSLEYALYSFGKFSKSSMPLFKRKIVDNKLVGLQSAGDLKKKNLPTRTGKTLRNNST